MSGYFPINPVSLIAGAANVKGGDNPSFTLTDFLAFYPQFTGNIDEAILSQFIAMANAVVQECRWHEQWKFGMCLFVAHFATLYLQTLGGGNPTAKQVIGAAQARGLQTSKSVGGVSVSYDFSTIAGDLQGWAMWKSTQYGLQFANMAKLLGKAGMYVW